MAVQTTRDQGKSMFIKEVLVDNPDATHQDILAEWQAAGMPGGISPTLVSRVRSREGLTRRRGRRRASAAAATKPARQAASKAQARGRSGRLMELEVELDRLLMKVAALGSLPEVEDTLRKTRRQLYAGLAATS